MSADSPHDALFIKPFTAGDWAVLCGLRVHQLAEHGIFVEKMADQPDLDSPYETDYHRMEQVYLHGAGNFWIAWWDETPVGHIGAQDVGGAIELRRLYVRAAYRRRGVGSALVRTLIAHCTAYGARAIELWTAVDGPGRSLYARLGFRVVKQRGQEFKDVPNSPGEIRMRLALTGSP